VTKRRTKKHRTKPTRQFALQYVGQTSSANSTVLTQIWSKQNKVKMKELHEK